MMKTFIDARTVARLIGMTSGAAFLAARARLEDEAGFPLPIPTCLRPLKWRRNAVQDWIAAQGLPRPHMHPDINQAGPNVVLMREAVRV